MNVYFFFFLSKFKIFFFLFNVFITISKYINFEKKNTLYVNAKLNKNVTNNKISYYFLNKQKYKLNINAHTFLFLCLMFINLYYIMYMKIKGENMLTNPNGWV